MDKLDKKTQNIHKGHRDRMRKRFAKTGLNGFSSHEILEFLLFPCLLQKDTNRLAHRLISEFGNINGVFTAPINELSKVDGIGESTATFIRFVGELISTSAEAYDDRLALDTPEKRIELFEPLFENTNVETIFVMALDKDKKPIRNMRIDEGSFDTSTISIPKITRLLVSNGAVYAIVAHSHASISAFPSMQDVKVTERLIQALESVDVELLDHVIIANGDSFSFMNSGKKLYGRK